MGLELYLLDLGRVRRMQDTSVLQAGLLGRLLLLCQLVRELGFLLAPNFKLVLRFGATSRLLGLDLVGVLGSLQRAQFGLFRFLPLQPRLDLQRTCRQRSRQCL